MLKQEMAIYLKDYDDGAVELVAFKESIKSCKKDALRLMATYEDSEVTIDMVELFKSLIIHRNKANFLEPFICEETKDSKMLIFEAELLEDVIVAYKNFLVALAYKISNNKAIFKEFESFEKYAALLNEEKIKVFIQRITAVNVGGKKIDKKQ